MGAWGHNLTESDDAYDYLDKIESWFPGEEAYKIIREEEMTVEEHDRFLTVFTNNKIGLRNVAENSYSDEPAILLYTAFLKYLELPLDEKDTSLFTYAYTVERERANDWDKPEGRIKELDKLFLCVYNSTKYSFSHKGLFQKAAEHLG